jgi:hypothetical protein
MGIFQNNAIIPAMPKGVAQAFSLLQSSPEAQVLAPYLFRNFSIFNATTPYLSLNFNTNVLYAKIFFRKQ